MMRITSEAVGGRLQGDKSFPLHEQEFGKFLDATLRCYRESALFFGFQVAESCLSFPWEKNQEGYSVGACK